MGRLVGIIQDNREGQWKIIKAGNLRHKHKKES